MKTPQKESEDKCDSFLDSYIHCISGHHGVVPSEYDTEWCESEKGLYIECRKNWARNRKENGELVHAIPVKKKSWQKE